MSMQGTMVAIMVSEQMLLPQDRATCCPSYEPEGCERAQEDK